jgi:hypothetical protein
MCFNSLSCYFTLCRRLLPHIELEYDEIKVQYIRLVSESSSSSCFFFSSSRVTQYLSLHMTLGPRLCSPHLHISWKYHIKLLIHTTLVADSASALIIPFGPSNSAWTTSHAQPQTRSTARWLYTLRGLSRMNMQPPSTEPAMIRSFTARGSNMRYSIWSFTSAEAIVVPPNASLGDLCVVSMAPSGNLDPLGPLYYLSNNRIWTEFKIDELSLENPISLPGDPPGPRDRMIVLWPDKHSIPPVRWRIRSGIKASKSKSPVIANEIF